MSNMYKSIAAIYKKSGINLNGDSVLKLFMITEVLDGRKYNIQKISITCAIT